MYTHLLHGHGDDRLLGRAVRGRHLVLVQVDVNVLRDAEVAGAKRAQERGLAAAVAANQAVAAAIVEL